MTYTAAQVGAANDPGQHTTVTAPAAMATLDPMGLPPERTTTLGGGLRGFRAPAMAPASPAPASPALDSTKDANANTHASRGEADARRNDTQLSGHPSGESAAFAPAVVEYHNDRAAVVISPTAPPERARQGFTGADPTRAAQHVMAYVMRPFDKGIAEHPGKVLKAEQPAPFAARSRQYADASGGYVMAGGHSGTAAVPVGPQPNTVRETPGAWDRTLINTGPEAPAPTHTRRAFR